MAAAASLTRAPAGCRLTGTFLVTAAEPRSYGDGKDCVVLTLSDAGGRIDSAPLWGARQAMVEGLGKGAVVEIAGEIQTYRGRRQLDISHIVRAIEPVDRAAFLPSAGDSAPRWAQVDRWRAAIRGPRLAAVLSLFFDDADFQHRYGQCPASTAGHHAALGGLLLHTCEVAAIGLALADTCGADRDLVLAGALLHDIGKLDAYRWDAGFETTEAGVLLGHVALGLCMIARRVALAARPPCTDAELQLLLHLVAAHHGRLEFGAPVAPMTLEAQVLHHADDASAKTASMTQALADPDNFTGEAPVSTRGIWQLERRKVYRGTSDWGEQKEERPPSRG